MKKVVFLSFLFTLAANFAFSAGIMCRDDRRMENGPLQEVILTQAADGYNLRSQFAPDFAASELKTENWGMGMECKLDTKQNIAFCSQDQGAKTVSFKERREVFFDSIGENAKKKSVRLTDIQVFENGQLAQSISFDAIKCESFGEAQ